VSTASGRIRHPCTRKSRRRRNYIYFGAKSDICHHALRQFDLGNVGINDARPINTINISCFEVFTVGDQNQAYAKAYKLLCHARTGTAHTDDADAQFLQKSLHVGANART